jgi:hypothetical protein
MYYPRMCRQEERIGDGILNWENPYPERGRKLTTTWQNRTQECRSVNHKQTFPPGSSGTPLPPGEEIRKTKVITHNTATRVCSALSLLVTYRRRERGTFGYFTISAF